MRPQLWQQLFQLAHRHRGHACQHAAKVGLGVDAVAFGVGDEAIKRGASLGGMVMFGEKPALAAVEGYFSANAKESL
jgi:hypothetical protein